MADDYLIPLIILVVGLLVLGLLIVYKFKIRGVEKREPDYRVFFILGITWIPLGLALDFSVFWILGVIYMVIGLVNRDKWKRKEETEC